MNTIDKGSLEKLIKNHGILLEHQTENTISTYFKKQPNCNIISSNVSQRLYSNEKKEYIEIDVFTEVEKQYPRMTLQIKKRGSLGSKWIYKEDYPPFKTNITFLIQCKGHPSNGFLLCRSPKIEKSYSYFETMIDKVNNLEIIMNRKGVNIVDWSYFYKVNEGQQKKIEKGKETEIVYQEDKGKFDKGIEQINESLLSYFDSPYYKLGDKGIVKIIPLLVTNSPIYSMEIKKSEIMFHEVPWVSYVNYHEPDRKIISDEMYINFFNFIHVVRYKEMDKFFDIVLDIEGDFSYPQKYNKLFHSFNI